MNMSATICSVLSVLKIDHIYPSAIMKSKYLQVNMLGRLVDSHVRH